MTPRKNQVVIRREQKTCAVLCEWYFMCCQGSRDWIQLQIQRVLAHCSDSHRNFLGKEKQSRWHQLRIVEGTRDVQGNDGALWLHPLSVGGRSPLTAGVWVLQCPLQLLGLLGG